MSNREIPVSLGKPSLRRRLEAYYSLISPDQIADQTIWLEKFQQIYDKYGGSHDGERKLSKKLETKYGSAVRLLLAESTDKAASKNFMSSSITSDQRVEHWYQLTDKEQGSGVLDFCSDRFDPTAVLKSPEEDVLRANPFVNECLRMDHIDLCRSRLPSNDPLYRTTPQRSRVYLSQSSSISEQQDAKKTSMFGPAMEGLQKGPFTILAHAVADRKRIRVIIRYVNGIRGTITGHLVAFDKHMNLLMRDVLEVYSLRYTDRSFTMTNFEQEAARRQQPVRQRHLRTILVRGDNVVMVYFAESERSVYPKTSKSPACSLYVGKCENIIPSLELGTQGSLLFAQQRKQGNRSYPTANHKK